MINNFTVIRHRGNERNMLNYSDARMKHVQENSLISFNIVATYPLNFVEFDVNDHICGTIS